MYENVETKEIAQEKVGKRIFVGKFNIIMYAQQLHNDMSYKTAYLALGWPCLQEGLVNAISDPNFRYELSTQADGTTEIIEKKHRADVAEQWKRRAAKLEHEYSKKRGTIIGPVSVLVHVRMLKGAKIVMFI